MSLANTLYQAVFRRTSTFSLAIICGAFFFERAFDVGAEFLYDSINKGKQWKDIKHKYETAE